MMARLKRPLPKFASCCPKPGQANGPSPWPCWPKILARQTMLYKAGTISQADWQERLGQIEAIVNTAASRYDQPLGYAITRQRLRCADCLLAQVWQAEEERPFTFKEKLDR